MLIAQVNMAIFDRIQLRAGAVVCVGEKLLRVEVQAHEP
jgi:hypothetical protein